MLSGREAREIRAHIAKCAECAALLEEEMALSARLSDLPDHAPVNDVWALVRARTKPRAFRPMAWLGALRGTPVVVRRAVAAAAVAAVVAFGIYTTMPEPPAAPNAPNPPRTVTVKWSDDPLGGHTDAMVKYIDNM